MVDRLNSVRRRAADAVAAGRPDEALAEIRSFEAEIAPQAARLPSAQVDAALEEADALADEVEQHAEGKRRLLPATVQQLRARGYSEGRAGSRK